MKKQLIVLGISALLVSGAAFTALAQQKENKNNKKEQQGKGQEKNKDKQDKQNGNRNNKGGDNISKGTKSNGKSGNDNGNKGNGNNANDNAKGNNGKNSNGKFKDDNADGFSWTSENFKDRKNLRNHEKVTVCHKVNKNNEPGVSITVSSNALKAHMNHGDVMGNCPVVNNNTFSNTFLTRRTDYYNTLQHSYEQVTYSRSILDYALQRLTNSRLQLATLQNNNVAQAEIDRKQAVVVELEQNVSLLETLVGVAANLVVNKLQQ